MEETLEIYVDAFHGQLKEALQAARRHKAEIGASNFEEAMETAGVELKLVDWTCGEVDKELEMFFVEKLTSLVQNLDLLCSPAAHPLLCDLLRPALRNLGNQFTGFSLPGSTLEQHTVEHFTARLRRGVPHELCLPDLGLRASGERVVARRDLDDACLSDRPSVDKGAGLHPIVAALCRRGVDLRLVVET